MTDKSIAWLDVAGYLPSLALICLAVFIIGFWAGARVENRRLMAHVAKFMKNTINILDDVRICRNSSGLSGSRERINRDIDKATGKNLH